MMNSSSNSFKRIIIDADPGVDDSMAILFAFCSPELIVEGITTIFGNSSTKFTTINALRLVELAGRSVPSASLSTSVLVARGAEAPLVRPFIGKGWRVHGLQGTGNVEFPMPQGEPDARRAAQFIVDVVMANPGEITLVPLGPLTNIALAVLLEPRIAEHVEKVVLMGGAANASGNASAVAEANIRNDPEAARIVFDAPWEVVMVGLDVTRKTIMTPMYLDSLTSTGNRFTDFIGQLIPHYLDFYRTNVGLDGIFVHDSSAIAYVIDPTLFTTKEMNVTVEIHSPTNFGLTAADWRLRSDGQRNASVCIDVDSDRFLDLYRQRLTEVSL